MRILLGGLRRSGLDVLQKALGGAAVMNTTAERVLSGPGPGPVPAGLSDLAATGAVVIGLGETQGPGGGPPGNAPGIQ
jgi:hypothetical protein